MRWTNWDRLDSIANHIVCAVGAKKSRPPKRYVASERTDGLASTVAKGNRHCAQMFNL
jgi:hypothetical protein